MFVSKRKSASILRKAANIIEVRGWCQGEYSINGKVCAIGALNTASGKGPWDQSANNSRALSAAQSLIGNQPLDEWNDNSVRTKDDVQKLLRQAAKALEHGLDV